MACGCGIESAHGPMGPYNKFSWPAGWFAQCVVKVVTKLGGTKATLHVVAHFTTYLLASLVLKGETGNAAFLTRA